MWGGGGGGAGWLKKRLNNEEKEGRKDINWRKHRKKKFS